MLSMHELSVLNKGLSFCPNKEINEIQLYGDMENCFRRLRLKEFFNQNLSDSQNPADVDSFSTPPPMQASNQIPICGSGHVAGSSAPPLTHTTTQISTLRSADIAGSRASPLIQATNHITASHSGDVAGSSAPPPLQTTKRPGKTIVNSQSTWTHPDGRNPTLDLYIGYFRKRVQTDIIKRKKHKPKDNLSCKEKDAIKSFQANNGIIIKPTDKGGAVVVMNKADYINEAKRQLDNVDWMTQHHISKKICKN